MDTSLFLAKLIGPMMLALGFFIMINPDRIRRIGHEFLASEALILLSGILTLPVGLAMVITHNIWAPDWRVIITLFGWITVVAGFARIFLPDLLQSVGKSMLEKRSLTTIPGVVMSVVGAYLFYKGYLS